MEKFCPSCETTKPLADFFASPDDSRAAQFGTSMYCKKCHADGKIKYGYGWWPDKWKSPDDVTHRMA